MSEYPLTPKQIEICNYLLSINHEIIDRDKLKSDGHNESDIRIVQNILIGHRIATTVNPIRLTDKGIKYSKKGIIKYFKNKRRDELLRSPTILTILFFIPVVISIFGTIISYNHSNEIENKSIDKEQINQYIDSTMKTKFNEFNKLTIDKPLVDKIKHD